MSVAVGSFAVFAASQVGTPGPANMALMAAGAGYGFRAVLPFVVGVIAGKQLVIWPVGFGLMELAVRAPLIFGALKWASAAYICWLAWRVLRMDLGGKGGAAQAPGFAAGLLVHPLNPKAWAMIVGGFTNFVAPGTEPLDATLAIAAVLCACQLVFHPLWALFGQAVAARFANTPAQPYILGTLAAATVLSVLFVLLAGGL